MSKFIDKLSRFSQGESQAFGFTARQSSSPKPKIQLVASMAAEDAEPLSARAAGADAVLLKISKPAAAVEALQKLTKSLPDIILGGWLQGGGNGDIERLTKAGCDFIVFPAASTPLAIAKNNKETGKILDVESSLSEGLLRTVNELPVDAVLIAGEEKEQPLTWQRLMGFRRFADLLTKPLLVSVTSQVTGEELLALWEAGVTAVVVEIDAKQPEDRLMKLRQEIDKLEFSTRRNRRGGALVPNAGQRAGRPATEEDDDEDDE